MENLINISKSLNINNITLEVNENNLSAIKLYNKFVFEEVGIRKNYYDGKYNAILMNKKINHHV